MENTKPSTGKKTVAFQECLINLNPLMKHDIHGIPNSLADAQDLLIKRAMLWKIGYYKSRKKLNLEKQLIAQEYWALCKKFGMPIPHIEEALKTNVAIYCPFCKQKIRNIFHNNQCIKLS